MMGNHIQDVSQLDMRYAGLPGADLMNQGYGYGAGMHMRSYDIPISMALEATVNFMEPLPEEQAVHADCIQQLENLVSQVGPGWEVKAFGSAANGFLSRGADLDVTCFKPDIPDQDSQMSVQELKFQFLPLLNKQQAFEVIQEVWSARVPIIKLRFMDIIDVDLSCHNPQALQNTYLLRAYSHLSPHIRQLVLCVKCWAKAEAVCGAPSGHLSSYSFALMVIYFLQVDPLLGLPCLPVAGFSSQGPTISLESYPWMGRRPLYELLTRFFTFYAESFAWGSEVVSIRTGRRLMVLDPEYAALPGRQASRIHVEDPFLPRNLNCVLWPENEEFLKQKIQHAHMTIQQGGVPDAFLQADPQKWLRQPQQGMYQPQIHPMRTQHSMQQVQQKTWMPNHVALSDAYALDRQLKQQQMRLHMNKALSMMPHDVRQSAHGFWPNYNYEVDYYKGRKPHVVDLNRTRPKGSGKAKAAARQPRPGEQALTVPYIREQLLRKKAQEDAAKEVTSSTLKTIADSLHARLEVDSHKNGNLETSHTPAKLNSDMTREGGRRSSAAAWLDEAAPAPAAPSEHTVPMTKLRQ